jgi:hypothetical protein
MSVDNSQNNVANIEPKIFSETAKYLRIRVVSYRFRENAEIIAELLNENNILVYRENIILSKDEFKTWKGKKNSESTEHLFELISTKLDLTIKEGQNYNGNIIEIDDKIYTKTATKLRIHIVSYNINQSADIIAQLLDSSNVVLERNKLTINNGDFSDWKNTDIDDTYLFTWVCDKLGLTFVSLEVEEVDINDPQNEDDTNDPPTQVNTS